MCVLVNSILILSIVIDLSLLLHWIRKRNPTIISKTDKIRNNVQAFWIYSHDAEVCCSVTSKQFFFWLSINIGEFVYNKHDSSRHYPSAVRCMNLRKEFPKILVGVCSINYRHVCCTCTLRSTLSKLLIQMYLLHEDAKLISKCSRRGGDGQTFAPEVSFSNWCSSP